MVKDSPLLTLQWQPGCALVNLRVENPDTALCSALAGEIQLPLQANVTTLTNGTRCIWAGPDDWFVLDTNLSASHTAGLVQRISPFLESRHHAITDVSSGYQVLRLSGSRAPEVLAQGCPLDLHSSQFKVGMCAGTHFFKASVWLWKTDERPSFELLVRSSFVSYVKQLFEKIEPENSAL